MPLKAGAIDGSCAEVIACGPEIALKGDICVAERSVLQGDIVSVRKRREFSPSYLVCWFVS